MKTKAGISIILFAVVFLLVGIYTYNYQSEPKLVISDAKYSSLPANFNDLKNEADLIVKGIKKDSKSYIKYFDEQSTDISDYYTISQINVKKVYKNNKNADVKPNTEIGLYEEAATDRNVLGQQTLYSQDGYQLMRTGEEYIIFLRESRSDPGKYILIGNIYGKYPTKLLKDKTYSINGDKEGTFRNYLDIQREVLDYFQ